MSIGTGIVLFVIGAILAFAVNVEVEAVNLDMIGYIMMGAGALVFIIGMAMLLKRRSTESTVRTVDPVAGERVTRSETRTSGDGTV
ncbi:MULTISPECIES: DUF6458 family protein [unclassified Microbacterium]|uniref:DUF6458 family protein n=1 Tax=unclassified Microbacterium TaxID=2609290 RepID=UPI00386797A3